MPRPIKRARRVGAEHRVKVLQRRHLPHRLCVLDARRDSRQREHLLEGVRVGRRRLHACVWVGRGRGRQRASCRSRSSRSRTQPPSEHNTRQTAASRGRRHASNSPTHLRCEYAGLVLYEWPHVPLDCLRLQVALEAVLGKPRASDDQALDHGPVHVPHDSAEHLVRACHAVVRVTRVVCVARVARVPEGTRQQQRQQQQQQ
jgi:hypothetical protein